MDFSKEKEVRNTLLYMLSRWESETRREPLHGPREFAGGHDFEVGDDGAHGH